MKIPNIKLGDIFFNFSNHDYQVESKHIEL